MGLVTGLSLAILGVLASPNLLLSRKPNAKELLDKIVPFQGWIGAVCALLGTWGVINATMNMGWLKSAPIWWCTYAGASALELGLGLLLGVGVLKSLIKAQQAHAKLDQVMVKLAPKQGLLGLLGVGFGAWCVVANFMFV